MSCSKFSSPSEEGKTSITTLQSNCIHYFPEDAIFALGCIQGAILGSGSSGHVVSVHHRETGKTAAAAKMFPLSTDWEVQSKRSRKFWDEVNWLNNFRHENIVTMISAVMCPLYDAILLEFCPYTLESIFTKIPLWERRRHVSHTAQALQFLHSQRVYHGDVKLSNILITTTGEAKLCDFDQTEQLKAGTPDLVSIWGGTLGYLGPEWHRNVEAVNPFKMDCYSLGVVLWAIIFLIHPDKDMDYLTKAWTILKPVSLIDRMCLRMMLEADPEVRGSMEDLLKVF